MGHTSVGAALGIVVDGNSQGEGRRGVKAVLALDARTRRSRRAAAAVLPIERIDAPRALGCVDPRLGLGVRMDLWSDRNASSAVAAAAVINGRIFVLGLFVC